MDYKTYLEFILAFGNKGYPQSVRYFWKLLDIDHKGYLDAKDIYLFFDSVAAKHEELGRGTIQEELKQMIVTYAVPWMYPLFLDGVTAVNL